MPNTNPNTHPTPGAFLNYARQYHQAAEELFDSKSHLTDVKYFLYFHATELFLKAYLRAHGGEPWGHEIGELYKDCRDLGLKITSDDRFGLQNIVSLLESGNEEMGFRYFSLKSGPIPDLNWTREVVGQLRQAVTAFVEPNAVTTPGPPVKAIFTIGKPVSKSASSVS
jgi:HEPN domain-containing protein